MITLRFWELGLLGILLGLACFAFDQYLNPPPKCDPPMVIDETPAAAPSPVV